MTHHADDAGDLAAFIEQQIRHELGRYDLTALEPMPAPGPEPANAIVAAVHDAARAAGFHDPADVVPRLDLTAITHDGHVNADRLEAALEELRERKPYLALDPTRFAPVDWKP